MADTLRRLRREKSIGPSNLAQTKPPLETLATTVIDGLISTITMTHNQKCNALGHQLCSDIARGIERCNAAGVRAIILSAQPVVTVRWHAAVMQLPVCRGTRHAGATCALRIRNRCGIYRTRHAGATCPNPHPR